MKGKIEFYILKCVSTALIVIPMALVMTATNTGLTAALLAAYPRNVLIAFAVAYPCSLLIHPLAGAITKALMRILQTDETETGNEI